MRGKRACADSVCSAKLSVLSHKYLTRCAASLSRRAALRLLAIVRTMPRRRALPGTTIRGRIEQGIVRQDTIFSAASLRAVLDDPYPRRRHGAGGGLERRRGFGGLIGGRFCPGLELSRPAGARSACRSWLADCRRRFRRVLRGIVPAPPHSPDRDPRRRRDAARRIDRGRGARCALRPRSRRSSSPASVC